MMSETRALVIRESGGPDTLSWETRELRPPAPDEVRLSQEAVGVNFIDVYHRTGYYPQVLPFVPGVESAGTIEAVGAEVVGFHAGDRVACVGPIGAYAERRNVRADRLVKLPKGIGCDQAAAMMLRGMTAHVLTHQVYPVRPGDWVLVHAAAGGTGLLLCQWAAALGARVIGTVSTEYKAALAHANGCHYPILYTSVDFVAAVHEITQGERVSVVFDSVGRETFLRSLECLRPRGTMVTFGQSSGPVEPIAPIVLSQKGSLTLTRPYLFHFIERRSELDHVSASLFDAVACGRLRIAIGDRFPLREAAKAHQVLEGRSTTGAIILDV